MDLPQEPVGQGPYSWEQIATIPGVIAATFLIVQYLKMPLNMAWKIPTRYWVLLTAFGLLALAQSMIRGQMARRAAGGAGGDGCIRGQFREAGEVEGNREGPAVRWGFCYRLYRADPLYVCTMHGSFTQSMGVWYNAM